MKRTFLFVLVISQLAFAQVSKQTLTINCGFQKPESDLITEALEVIFKEADIGLKVQVLPNKRSLVNANNGIDDGDATRIWNINKYYPNLLRVPLKTHHIDIVALSNRKLLIKKFTDLKPFHVGIVRGMKIVEVKVGAVETKSLTSINNYDQLLRMLASKRIDVIITDKTSLLNKIKEGDIKGLYLMEKPLLTLPLYIHLHKKHKALIPKLEKAVAELTRKGTLVKIENNFFNRLQKEVSSLVTLVNEK